jgi:hypothetical protein
MAASSQAYSGGESPTTMKYMEFRLIRYFQEMKAGSFCLLNEASHASKQESL